MHPLEQGSLLNAHSQYSVLISTEQELQRYSATYRVETEVRALIPIICFLFYASLLFPFCFTPRKFLFLSLCCGPQLPAKDMSSLDKEKADLQRLKDEAKTTVRSAPAFFRSCV